MNNHQLKLQRLLAVKKITNERIKQTRRKAHKELVIEYKPILIFFDILFIMAVLANFSALYITDYVTTAGLERSTMNTEKVVSYVELNPTANKIHDFNNDIELTPDDERIFKLFVIRAIFWSLPIMMYLYMRLTFNNTKMLYSIGLMATMYCFMLTYDLIHDLAVLIGSGL